MIRRSIVIIGIMGIILGLAHLSAQAQTLFGIAYIGSNGASTLYTIDPATGAATGVGTIGFERCSGMDFNASGTLFATCERMDGSNTHVLITINTTTGQGTEVGPTDISGLAGSPETATDISFDSNGTLFANLALVDLLATIDTGSGAASSIGETGLAAPGAALAFSSDNTLFHANDLDLMTLDTTNAFFTIVDDLDFSGTPNGFFRINAMDFHPSNGTLYASLNGGSGGSPQNFLATINTSNGTVTTIGATVNGLDAIAWGSASVPASCPDDVLISNYQTTSPQFVEVANVGTETIDLGKCSLVTFNARTELSIGSATKDLSGTLASGDTQQIAIAGAPTSGPGAIGIFNAPAPPNGTPFSTANEITGMVYLNNNTVFGISHLTVPAHNDIYACIYGGSGQGPFTRPFQDLADCLPR